MMSSKGLGRKRSWPNFKVLPRHLPGGTEGSYENPKPGKPVSGLDLNPGPPEYVSQRRVRR
jgi:hypothetical protein